MLLVVGYFEVVQRNSHINPAKNINVATSQTVGRFANEIELAKKSFSLEALIDRRSRAGRGGREHFAVCIHYPELCLTG
jgi:hypothetical protein